MSRSDGLRRTIDGDLVDDEPEPARRDAPGHVPAPADFRRLVEWHRAAARRRVAHHVVDQGDGDT